MVGSTLLKVLEEYNFPIKNLYLFASRKSVGKDCLFNNKSYYINSLNINSFKDIDFAFFCAGSEVSSKWAPIAEEAGCVVIDNSSYFRMEEDVDLVVPEVNFDKCNFKRKLIANPNCSTIQAVVCLNALKKFGLKRVVYTTYQAVSGSGIKGINDLKQTLSGLEKEFYPHDISKTCIPQIDSFLDNGFTKEEIKMVNETKKILDLPDLEVIATCIRVPVLYSHGVSVVVELEKEFNINDIYDAFAHQAGLIIIDDIEKNVYPTGIHSTGNDSVYIGRIRKDLFDNKSLLFYCVADNIRKGAASNAVSIALKIIEKSLSKGIAQEN